MNMKYLGVLIVLLGMNTGAVASTRAACAKQASDPNGPLDWRDEEAAWLCNKVSSSSTTPVILSCAKYLYDPNGYNLNSTEATRFCRKMTTTPSSILHKAV